MAPPMQPPVLSAADRLRLEALIRNPQTFAGTSQAVVDETLKRAAQVLEQSKANEQALRVAAEQREAAVRQVLDGAVADSETQIARKRQEVQALIQGLIVQIEAILDPAPKP